MLLQTSALCKIKDLVEASLRKMDGLNKPRIKFFSSLMELWLGHPCRYTFSSLARFGRYCEKSLRLHFHRRFDFMGFNLGLIGAGCGAEKIAAFDPSYVSKSGKKTHGLGWFWSGKAQRSLKGLELGGLALIDVAARTAMSLCAVQTPDRASLEAVGRDLVDHYAGIILDRMDQLKTLVNYLAVDGYFMKSEFILPIVEQGLHVITKMRPDANLRYLYSGPQRKGAGRPRKLGAKVDCIRIDRRRLRLFAREDGVDCYSGTVHCVVLKRIVRIVYIHHGATGRYELLLCTDPDLNPAKILDYYRLRFQIEFLFRDAKQHAGLEQCQARSAQKLGFHFNMALSAVSAAKAATWLDMEPHRRQEFSMAAIKTMHHNKLIADRIFANLGLQLNNTKIKQIYEQCIFTGLDAA